MHLAARLLPLLALAAPAQALVLTLDLPSSVNDDPLPADYADFVAANPQAGYTYGAAGGLTDQIAVTSADLVAWDTGFADLTNVVYVNTAVTEGAITFTANSGYLVTLDSFRLGGFADSNADFVSFIIDDGASTEFFATGPLALSETTADTFDLDDWTTPISAAVIRIRILDTNIAPGSVGLDDIQITQTAIPEPSAFATLAALGSLAFAAGRRRARR